MQEVHAKWNKFSHTSQVFAVEVNVSVDQLHSVFLLCFHGRDIFIKLSDLVTLVTERVDAKPYDTINTLLKTRINLKSLWLVPKDEHLYKDDLY